MKYKSKIWLKQQIKEKSVIEISKLCNCTPGTIRHWMDKFNIERKKNKSTRDGSVKRICEICSKEFTIFKTWLRGGKAGKYCSLFCVGKAMEALPHPNKRVKLICTICKKEYEVRNYRSNTSKCCSNKCRYAHTGKILSGENHPNWKGGITDRDRTKLIEWAKVVKKRDNYKCIECENNNIKILQAHHIKNWSNYALLRFDIDNGVTLCKFCHAKKHPEIANFILKYEYGKYSKKKRGR